MTDAQQRALCQALSGLLSYPGAEARQQAAAARELGRDTGLAEPLARFAERTGRLSPAALEELYTSTFDLQAACLPYVGHQLLGDGPQRGPFLARLVEVYRDGGYTARHELPDHLTEALAFLAVAPPSAERDDLVVDGLQPALVKMLDGFEDRDNPYRDLLVAAQALLRPARPSSRAGAQAEVRP